MANARGSNSIFVDSTGDLGAPTNTKVIGILFTPSTAADSLTLTEVQNGDTKLKIVGATAHQTNQYRLGDAYLVFVKGIYVQAISSGATALLITSASGSQN